MKAGGNRAAYPHSMGRASQARNMRTPTLGRQSLSDSERFEGAEGSVCPVGTWAKGPKRPGEGQRNHEHDRKGSAND